MEKFLYHGSPRKLIGNALKPKKPKDLNRIPSNAHRAVYATNLKDIAIAHAIMKSGGVLKSALNFNREPFLTIYEGWPDSEAIYLHTLSRENFYTDPVGSRQWICFEPVRPIKTEELMIEDYLHLVRVPTINEAERWRRKMGFAPSF